MKSISRRKFVKRGMACMGAVVAPPWLIPAAAWGKGNAAPPSERITLGGIGIGGMGRYDLGNFLTHDDVQVLAVCDVDGGRLSQAKRQVDDHYGNTDCAAYKDFREVLARDDIDAVLIATPDHWHAILSIEAAKAGKDMYCEKPISVTVAEGRAVVETMRRYGTVYQSGTQRRSIDCFRFAVDAARDGKVGNVHTLHTYLSYGQTCGIEAPQPVPKNFDYDRWLGPAPFEPYTAKRCHGSFRWIFDYSGGQLTDIGAHFNDLAQMGNASEFTGPVRYEGWADFPEEELFDTPVHYEVRCTYADGKVLIMHDLDPRTVKFEGDEGWISVDDSGKVSASPASLVKDSLPVQQDYRYMQAHQRNFLECIRTREPTIAPPEIAHRSTTICHIGNLCLRLGRTLEWDPDTERFLNDDEANRMLARSMRAPWRLG